MVLTTIVVTPHFRHKLTEMAVFLPVSLAVRYSERTEMNSDQTNVVHLRGGQDSRASRASLGKRSELIVMPLTDAELFVVRIKSLGVILQDSGSQSPSRAREPFNPALIASVCYSCDGAPGERSWTLVLKDGTELPATDTNGGASVVTALNVLHDLRTAEALLGVKPRGA